MLLGTSIHYYSSELIKSEQDIVDFIQEFSKDIEDKVIKDYIVTTASK